MIKNNNYSTRTKFFHIFLVMHENNSAISCCIRSNDRRNMSEPNERSYIGDLNEIQTSLKSSINEIHPYGNFRTRLIT